MKSRQSLSEYNKEKRGLGVSSQQSTVIGKDRNRSLQGGLEDGSDKIPGMLRTPVLDLSNSFVSRYISSPDLSVPKGDYD